jgi:hypothetical protein
LKVDKVYIKVQRDRRRADGPWLEPVKKFLLDHGVRVADGSRLRREQTRTLETVRCARISREARKTATEAGAFPRSNDGCVSEPPQGVGGWGSGCAWGGIWGVKRHPAGAGKPRG